MSKEMRIQDLFPVNSSFALRETKKTLFGRKEVLKKYNLIPCTALKLVEISNVFGDVNELIAAPNLENMCKMAMALMEVNEAEKFAPRRVKMVDPKTGVFGVKTIGGYEVLMNMVKGMDEFLNIYEAVLYSLGYNKEFVKEIIDGITEGVDKKVDEEVKKKIPIARSL